MWPAGYEEAREAEEATGPHEEVSHRLPNSPHYWYAHATSPPRSVAAVVTQWHADSASRDAWKLPARHEAAALYSLA